MIGDLHLVRNNSVLLGMSYDCVLLLLPLMPSYIMPAGVVYQVIYSSSQDTAAVAVRKSA